MSQRQYEVLPGHHGGRIKVTVSGSELLRIPRLNRGTAFTLEERQRFNLIGHLPTGVTPLEAQLHRSYNQFLRAETDLDKFAFLSALRDRNTVLFYRLLSEHLDEMMPIVYTPTIGAGDRRVQPVLPATARGLPVHRPPGADRALAPGPAVAVPRTSTCSSSPTPRASSASATRGSAASRSPWARSRCTRRPAGIDPNRVIAIVLDVGTDNLALLNDPLYLGLRHSRVRGRALRRLHRGVRHRGDLGVPARDDPLGGLRRRQRPPHPQQVPRAGLHLQRRRAGHCGGGGGCGPGRGPLPGRAAARPADRHPRCRHGRGRRRRPDARHDDRRGRDTAAGHCRVLGARQPRAAHRPRSGAGSAPSSGRTRARAPRPTPGRLDAEGHIGLADVVAQCAAHHPDRNLGATRGLHRAHRARDGRARGPSDHHAAVEPHLAGGGARPRTCWPGPTVVR